MTVQVGALGGTGLAAPIGRNPGVDMRILTLPFLIIAIAAPAFAQPKLGARTQPPQQIAPAAEDPEAEIRAAIEAANAHPLGSLANPVRAAGPEGERAYLARLRCADGASPDIGAKRPAGVSGYGSVANLYPLDCRAAGPGKLDLVMDQYHAEHVETRAPAGFTFETR